MTLQWVLQHRRKVVARFSNIFRVRVGCLRTCVKHKDRFEDEKRVTGMQRFRCGSVELRFDCEVSMWNISTTELFVATLVLWSVQTAKSSARTYGRWVFLQTWQTVFLFVMTISAHPKGPPECFTALVAAASDVPLLPATSSGFSSRFAAADVLGSLRVAPTSLSQYSVSGKLQVHPLACIAHKFVLYHVT